MRTLPSDPADLARLGKTIRELRKGAGLTQESLAGSADLSKNYVADVERGERNPSFIVLCRLVRALGVTWAQFGTAIDAE